MILRFEQPHLQRTKLCDLKDGELDQSYVQKREQLKEVVKSIIRPKIVEGKSPNGNEFVAFLEKVHFYNPIGGNMWVGVTHTKSGKIGLRP